MTYGNWHIEQLRFTGNGDKRSLLNFSPGLSLVYGASNTGKSFALKALDFMFGGQIELPNIKERRSYERLWLDIGFPLNRRVSLERSIVGGPFRLHEGGATPRTLAQRHDAKSPDNISTFLLTQMGAAGRKVSIDAAGTQTNLSFRDIAAAVLVNEIAIQSEDSPVESGDSNTKTRERNVFKFMLTGEDDSAIVPAVKAKDFKVGRVAKVSFLQSLLDQIDTDLSKDYSDIEGLKEQDENLNEALRRIENEVASARSSIRALLDEKRRLSSEISAAERRSEEIALGLDSFHQLDEVYTSDISRLESIEEAGFVLSLAAGADCPTCGAAPEFQVHSRGLAEIDAVRVSAEVEIQKIQQQRIELLKTVEHTKSEGANLAIVVEKLRDSLREVELLIEERTPSATQQQRALSEVLSLRDHVRRGLGLVEDRSRLARQKNEIESATRPKRDPAIQRGLSTETAREFAEVVSEVLAAWGFPGQRRVVFDLSTYDLIIDGKERRNNGKGVRAITHAAFKVALMLFCLERGLPHPGFLVLDTPLLTYRDPMKSPGDSLTADEKELRHSNLKKRFFDHLGHLGAGAQIIVFENVDPPEGVQTHCNVEVFTNDPAAGRQGLL